MLRMPLKRLKTAIADSLKTVDFICDVNFSRGSIQAVLKTFEIPRPILYRKEIRKNGRQLVGYENATGRPIVPFGKYARCHTPIISENRIGIVETDEGKFIAIDHTGKKLFEIMFQSPVLSVEDLFRYGYFIYVTRNGRQSRHHQRIAIHATDPQADQSLRRRSGCYQSSYPLIRLRFRYPMFRPNKHPANPTAAKINGKGCLIIASYETFPYICTIYLRSI